MSSEASSSGGWDFIRELTFRYEYDILWMCALEEKSVEIL